MNKFIQTYFFQPSIFPLSTKQKGGKLKFFLSSHFSTHLPFSILSVFHSSNQMNPPCYFPTRLFTFHSFSFIYFKTSNQSYLISFHFILFHSNQIKRREIKIFSILPFFHSPTIFYSPTFSPLQPNGPLESKILAISVYKI